MPWCLGAAGSVRTSKKHQSAKCAPEVHTFWPLTTKWSPWSTARVRRLARSPPAPGSEKPWHQRSSPARMRGKWRFFCASVPHWIRVGPSRLIALAPGRIGARARKYSSSKITCCIKSAPRPPYSLGQEMPTQPAAYIVFCQAMRFSKVSRSGATRWSAASSTLIPSGRLISSQFRNSARKTACSGLSAKSMIGVSAGNKAQNAFLSERYSALHDVRAGLGWQGKKHRAQSRAGGKGWRQLASGRAKALRQVAAEAYDRRQVPAKGGDHGGYTCLRRRGGDDGRDPWRHLSPSGRRCRLAAPDERSARRGRGPRDHGASRESRYRLHRHHQGQFPQHQSG